MKENDSSYAPIAFGSLIRRFLLIFTPIAIVVAIVLIAFFHYDLINERILIQKEQEKLLLLKARAINIAMRPIISDLIFLSKERELRALVNESKDFYREAIEDEWQHFIVEKGIYNQVRYIGIDGKEVVRVNISGEGASKIIDEDGLQDKSHRYYFKDAIKLNKNEIYISPLDLNVEHQKIEIPKKPMIRIIIPIFNEGGIKKGLLVLNCFAAEILQTLVSVKYSAEEHTSLLNMNGYYLYDYIDDNTFGFMFKDKRDVDFEKDHPDIWKDILGSETGYFHAPNGLFLWSRIYPFRKDSFKFTNKNGYKIITAKEKSSKDYYWTLVSHLDEKKFDHVSYMILKGLLQVYISFLVIIAIASVIFARMTLNKQIAEEALLESQEKFRAISESAQDAIVLMNNDGNIIYWNDAAVKMYGYTRDEAYGQNLYDLLMPVRFHEERKNVLKNFNVSGESNSIGQLVEYQNIRKDGSEFPMELSCSALKIKDKWHALGIVRDITDRVKAKEALIASEEKYRMLFDNATDSIFIAGEDGRILDVNDVACRTLGYSKEELLTMTPEDLDAPDVQTEFDLVFKESMEKGFKVFERIHRTKYNKMIPVEVRTRSIEFNDAPALIAIVRDITERIKTEDERRKDYLDSIGSIVVAINNAGEVDFINKAGCDLLGYMSEDIIGKNWCESYCDKEYLSSGECTFSEILVSEFDEVNNFESSIKTKELENRIIRWNITTLKDNYGTVNGVICTGEDITEQKKAEEYTFKNYQNQLAINALLKISTEKTPVSKILEDVLDIILSVSWLNVQKTALIFLVDHEKKMIKMRAFRGLTSSMVSSCANLPYGKCLCGIAAETKKVVFKGKIDEDHTVKYDDMAPHGHYVVPILAGEKVIGILCLYLNEGHKSDDFEVTFLEAFAGTLSTIIMRKRAEDDKEKIWAQLLQAQKLESIGRLTGGLAHDFNNVLTTTIGFSSLAFEQLPEGHPVRDMVERIYNSGKKASKMVDNLLTFSKKQVLAVSLLDINSVIENTMYMLTGSLGEDVKLKVNSDPSIKNILADETQIEQILMNIVINARHAMPDGGTINVITKNVLLDEDFAREHPEINEGKYVLLSISDSGLGMSDDVMDKIFEPFFTTKREGKGTGLGLSIVFGIVKQNNGHIFVESEVGKGSEFKIYFPALMEDKSVEIIKDDYESPAGKETILIVEDDDSVRKLLLDSLRPLGYNVLEASSGEAALALSEENEEHIDMLLTDVIMSGMNGLELDEKMKGKRPDISTVFISGFVESQVVIENIQNSNKPFIKKPFSPHDLFRVIRKALDSNLKKT
ncbi:PAS domain S-box protein [Thermodesulfobacteriota bacterium]